MCIHSSEQCFMCILWGAYAWKDPFITSGQEQLLATRARQYALISSLEQPFCMMQTDETFWKYIFDIKYVISNMSKIHADFIQQNWNYFISFEGHIVIYCKYHTLLPRPVLLFLTKWKIFDTDMPMLKLKRIPDLGPILLMIFPSQLPNYNIMIATNFCARHDSTAVVACANICIDLINSNWRTAIRICHRIWISSKNVTMGFSSLTEVA